MKKIRCFLIHFVFALSFISLASTTCLAATYYVDKNHASASDANPGTQDQPWLTINQAAQTMLPGDITYIRSGTYNEQVVTERSGTSTEGYITFSAYTGEKPAIDGSGVTTGNNGIIVQHSYIKLRGLEVLNWNDNGIWVVNAGYLEISDCEVHHVNCGIGFVDGTHDFVLNRVEMHHFDLYGFDASMAGGEACYNGTFNDCVAHTARDQTQNVDGFALGHGTQSTFVFNRCKVYDVFDGFDISAANTTLNRCSAHDCGNTGFKIWQDNVMLVNCISYNNSITNVELDWDGESGKTTLQNCTFVNAGDFNVWVENSGDSLDMFNCILAGGENVGLAFEQMGTSNYHGDYNLFHIAADGRMVCVGYEDEFFLSDIESGSWTAYSGQDSHSVVVHEISEIFVDPASFDFHLLSTSPAVDTGTGVGAPDEDFDADSRPQGAGYDIGAYEYLAQGTRAFLIYFPHIASNGVWETEICIINTSSEQSLSADLKAYNSSGQEVSSTPVMLASNARREIIISNELPNPSDIGYIILESDSENVCGYTKFYTEGKYRVAIPAVKELNTSDIYISHIDSSDQWWTGLSLLNTTDSERTLTIDFDNGESKSVTLAPGEHQAFTIRDLFDGQPQPDINSAVITNASGVVGLELFGSGNQLSGILIKDDTASTIYYPHVAGGEWWTGMVAFNPSASSATLTITPFAEGGTSLATQSLDIPAGGKYIGTVSQLSLPPGTAWLTIDSTNPITGFELFGTTNGNQLAGYTGVRISGREGIFAKIEKNGWTGIAFVNIEDSAASVTLTAYDNYGTTVATQTISLAGHAKVVDLAENIFSGNDISAATYIGYSSDRDIVGFQLNGSSDDMMLDGLPGM
jgi:hypothetical protein